MKTSEYRRQTGQKRLKGEKLSERLAHRGGAPQRNRKRLARDTRPCPQIGRRTERSLRASRSSQEMGRLEASNIPARILAHAKGLCANRQKVGRPTITEGTCSLDRVQKHQVGSRRVTTREGTTRANCQELEARSPGKIDAAGAKNFARSIQRAIVAAKARRVAATRPVLFLLR
jgi:hypothetical protein